MSDDLRATLVHVRGIQAGEPVHLGTGVVTDADGYILITTSIADRRMELLSARLADGRELPARLVGIDAYTQLALLKVDAQGLTSARRAALSSTAVGDPVLAVTLGEGEEIRATTGTIRALVQPIRLVNYIETDVGDIDGPIFNSRGEAIGFNTLVSRNSNRAFAIPIETAIEVRAQLQSHGKVRRGRLGLVVQMLTAELAAARGLSMPTGALVNSVEAGGPAQRAGLRAGDVILEIDGKPVRSSADIPPMTSALKPGSRVAIQVWRDGAARTFKTGVGELVESAPAAP